MRRRSRGICEGDAPVAAATATATVTATGGTRGEISVCGGDEVRVLPVRRVHGDSAMFVGGLSALLLQSLHPEAMTSVSAHPGSGAISGGRLQRTSAFLATTRHGTADSAWSACERVRAGHARVHGVADEGVPYRLTPPCAPRVPPSGRRCHDEAPPLSRGPPRRRPTFIPPIRSLSRPPRPISWERDSRLDGDAIQPPRGRPGRGTSADRRARRSHDALAAKTVPASAPGCGGHGATTMRQGPGRT
ncbi:oxygenase MpaB family protein [[Kitasatospora] papulosa]|uniref:oxygenase MpaB family protein n=1 Tax=[Kitasatospora] papulosa TaxID=1464011 RepID=UPI0036A1FF93